MSSAQDNKKSLMHIFCYISKLRIILQTKKNGFLFETIENSVIILVHAIFKFSLPKYSQNYLLSIVINVWYQIILQNLQLKSGKEIS